MLFKRININKINSSNKNAVINCSRKGVFGNPFRMTNNSDAERQRVIKEFKDNFDSFPLERLRKVIRIKKKKGIDIIFFACYCRESDACHCDIIIDHLKND